MDFPLIDLLDAEEGEAWLEKHFHPQGLKCPHCQASRAAARLFRVNRASGLNVYRCEPCDGIYNLYSGTVFAGSQLTPPHVVWLLQGILQGKPSNQLAREIGLTEKTVLKWRHRLQAQAERLQPTAPLPDTATESDEMFQNAGEKRRGTLCPH
jgi:transposase-like protein